MALRQKSIFWYGITIDSTNRSIDFRTANLGPIYQATLTLGNYTLSGFIAEIGKQLKAANSTTTFTVSLNRSFGLTSNRLTLGSSTGFFQLLFGTGPRYSSSAARVMGFTATDKTGLSSYTGTSNVGIYLLPEYKGYTYLGPDFMHTVFGALNVSARGDKEAIVWSIQKFFQVEFKYEPETKVITEWLPFMDWLIQQRPIEYVPDYTIPNTFYQATLESSPADGKGLAYTMKEMLPDFPFNYQTGTLKFRQKEF